MLPLCHCILSSSHSVHPLLSVAVSRQSFDILESQGPGGKTTPVRSLCFLRHFSLVSAEQKNLHNSNETLCSLICIVPYLCRPCCSHVASLVWLHILRLSVLLSSSLASCLMAPAMTEKTAKVSICSKA